MEQITAEQIQTHINTSLGTEFQIDQDVYQVFNLKLDIHQLFRLFKFLYNDEKLKLNFLTDICGVHYPDQQGKELGVVYHLHSMQLKIRLRIKVFVSIDKPEVPSLTGIFATANWMERETYDFYGIQFLGHPNLKRILNMDEMTAFPMRKEFPLEDPTREDKADFQFGR